jgi:hypothetical protein
MKNRNYLNEEIAWNSTDNPEHPYRAFHEGKELFIRLNDFPAEQLYTLIADGREITNFDDWAAAWSRAPKPAEKRMARSTSAAKSAAKKVSSRAFGKAKTFGVSVRKG